MQNTSHAVMSQRIEAPDSLDDFPTPCWGTRALIEHVIRPHHSLGKSVWEPACGRGYMVRPLQEYFKSVAASDVFSGYDYFAKGTYSTIDFLFPGSKIKADWIITNPPFRLGAQFVHRALECCNIGCAVLVRTVFLEGGERWKTLFERKPPAFICPFVERLPILRGRVDREASSATSYSWFVWLKDQGINGDFYRNTEVVWIPPCRAKLERDGDYPDFVAVRAS